MHRIRKRTAVRPSDGWAARRARNVGGRHRRRLFTFPEMNLQDVGQHESLSAVVADVGALSVVRLSVHPNVPRRREPLLTDLADVALLVGRRRPTFAPFSIGPHDSRPRSAHQARSPRDCGVYHAHGPHCHPDPSRRRRRCRHFVRHRRASRSRSARAPFSASRRCRRWTGHHVWRDCRRRRSDRVGVRRSAAERASRKVATSPGRYSGRKRKGERRGDAAHHLRCHSRGRRRWCPLFPRSGRLTTSGSHPPCPRLPAVGSPSVRARRSRRSSESPRGRGNPASRKLLNRSRRRRQSPEGVGVG